MIEVILINHLLADPGLNNLVAGCVYQVVMPQSASHPRAVVITKISDPRKEFGTRRPRFQFSCFAKSALEAKIVAEQVRKAVKELEGVSSIFAVYPENERDSFEPDTKLYHVALDAIIYYFEEE